MTIPGMLFIQTKCENISKEDPTLQICLPKMVQFIRSYNISQLSTNFDHQSSYKSAQTTMFCDFNFWNMSWSMLKMKIAWVVEKRKFHGMEPAISLAFSIWVQNVVASAAARVSLLLFLF